MSERRISTIDTQGSVRSGPCDAWWIWLQDRTSWHGVSDIPRARAHGWNVAAAGYLILGGLLAYHLGELYALLVVLLGLSALGVVGLVVVYKLSARRYVGPYPDSADLSGGQVPDRSRTAVRTGVRTALTAVPDNLADRTADSGQAVRVQVADR